MTVPIAVYAICCAWILFVGSTFKQHFLLTDVRVEWPEEKPQDEIFAFVHRGDLIAFFPMVSGRYRIIVAYQPGSALSMRSNNRLKDGGHTHNIIRGSSQILHPIAL
jgi:hypothetical protein